MKMKAASTLLALVLAGTVTLLPCSADAARMGGGRSFGSQPSMRAPAPRPAPAQPYTQQRPMQQPRPMNQPAQPRGGMGFGGGLLGGLLAGSVLGSLFGGGGQGQVAGEAGQSGAAGGGGIGLFDIIILLGGIWLLMRLFKRRQQAQQAGGPFGRQPAGDQPGQPPFGGSTQYAGQTAAGAGAGAAWSSLRGQQAPEAGFGQPNIPPDFNAEEFLRGAKMAYTRMQAAWDRRDIATIAQFATPAVVQELERQKAEDPNPSQTQILLVNASLQSVEEFGDKDRAAVYFDVVMREDPNQEQPTHAREIWTFVRQHQTGNWQLDGLQQVE